MIIFHPGKPIKSPIRRARMQLMIKARGRETLIQRVIIGVEMTSR